MHYRAERNIPCEDKVTCRVHNERDVRFVHEKANGDTTIDHHILVETPIEFISLKLEM